jgi:type III secretion protein U
MSAASKTEKPTPKKRRDAAKKGQTFKAKDMATTCLMAVAYLYLAGDGALLRVMEVVRRAIENGFDTDLGDYVVQLAWLLLSIIAPLVLICFLAGAIPLLLTTGMALALEALKLNFGALNPISGFKRIFSLRTVKDTVKAALYLGCFVVAFWIVWDSQKALLFGQLNAPVKDLFGIWGHLLQVLVLVFLCCILLVVIADALCEYWLYIKDLKMDKDAVKREHKEQEGSPEMKGRRRDLHRELLDEQIKSDIRGSRVIVANPTHIAVGIYFRPEVTVMPFISLMETNQRALAVRKYAASVGVPVVTDIALARLIYKTHQRYSFVRLSELEQVLRLLVWLEEVERAGD